MIFLTFGLQGRVLIHFDGWSINHDYWARPDGPNLHGVGWAAATKKKLIPPEDSQVYKETGKQKPLETLKTQDTPSSFTWAAYLASQGAKAVPAWAFPTLPSR